MDVEYVTRVWIRSGAYLDKSEVLDIVLRVLIQQGFRVNDAHMTEYGDYRIKASGLAEVSVKIMELHVVIEVMSADEKASRELAKEIGRLVEEAMKNRMGEENGM